MDLSKLSDADLLALQKGDLSKVSDTGLAHLAGKPSKVTKEDSFDKQLKQDAQINPALEFGANVVGGLTGIMRGGANIVGGVFGKSKLGQELWPTEALDKASIGYTLGEVIDPISMILGTKAMQLAGKVPMVAKAGKMAPVVQGVIGGAGAGAATGALSEGGDAGSGAALGAAVAGGIPLVGKGVSKLAQIAAPLTKSGAQVAGGRMLSDVVGASRDDVLAALRTNRTPFVNPTVAQATSGLRNPEIAALQRISEIVNPIPGTQRVLEQRAGRSGLLQSFAGDDASIAAAKSARGAAFADDIAVAQQAGVLDRLGREATVMPPRPVETLVPSNLQPGMRERVLTAGEVPTARTAPILEGLRQNPMINAAIADAKSLARGDLGLPESMKRLSQAQVDDILKDPMQSLEGLQLVKFAIDNRLAPSMTDSASAKVKIADKAVANVKNALMQGVRQTGEGGAQFIKANEQFGQRSGEIFQQKVGKNMLELLQKPLGEGETGAKLARAIEAETGLVRKSGGFMREGLEEQLTPENVAKVGKVINQLDVDTSLDELARRGMGSAKIKDAVGKTIELPNLMNQAVAVTNSMIRRVFGAGQIRTLKELAVTMQDPQMMARMMEDASVKEKNALKFMENSMRYYSPYGAAYVGSTE